MSVACATTGPALPAGVSIGEGGVIYLIHLEGGLRVRDGSGGPVFATHYTGWTRALAQRIAEHEAGRGSAFMAEVARRGIGWRVVRCWSGTRTDERRIKRQRNAPEFCPCCQELGRNHRALRQAPGVPETYRFAPGAQAEAAGKAGKP